MNFPRSLASREVLKMMEAISGVSSSVFIKEPNGKILFGNDAFHRSFVMGDAASTNLSYQSLPGDLRSISQSTDRHVATNNVTMRFSYDLEDCQGVQRRYVTTKVPLLNSNGQTEAILGVSVDWVAPPPQDLLEARDIRFLQEAQSTIRSLGEKNKQVLLMACEGHTNKRISRVLEISERSVERYRSEAMKTVGVKSFAGLVQVVACLRDLGFMNEEH